MIKYCTDCKHAAIKSEPYPQLRCYNPLVNKNDPYMVSNVLGKGYGTECIEQRRYRAYFWNKGCGLQARFWEHKEVEL